MLRGKRGGDVMGGFEQEETSPVRDMRRLDISVHNESVKKVNFEIYIADRKATTCI